MTMAKRRGRSSIKSRQGRAVPLVLRWTGKWMDGDLGRFGEASMRDGKLWVGMTKGLRTKCGY